MEIIYTTIVGSKMHGLQTPSSDEDTRYITKHSLSDVISPFKNEKIKVESGNGEDTESWELCHFVKHLASGNPTCYEVIKSPLYTPNEFAEELRNLFPAFIDVKKVCAAHCGYAEAQLKRYLRKAKADFEDTGVYQLSDMWDENQYRRVPKSIVAAYRVLAQGRQLLLTGDFQPVIKEYDHVLHTFLMSIKVSPAYGYTYDNVCEHLKEIETQIQELNSIYNELPAQDKVDRKPDIERIEKFLLRWYVKEDPDVIKVLEDKLILADYTQGNH